MNAQVLQAVWAVVLLTGTGTVLGLVVGIVVKLFGAEIDPRIEEIEGLLPGANCGGCGFAGCVAFAEALAHGKAEPTACPSNSAAAVERICALLGVAAGTRNPKVAVVLCGGDNAKARQAALYNGVVDCKDAMLVAGGAKGCRFGCLGLGTCARACPFAAIEITAAGIARVHREFCTGCGKCVAACPRNLIRLVPADAPVHVLCSSPEKGAAKRGVCEVACIGCRKCVKASGEDHITMNGFLAVVNYDNPPTAEVAAVCPTGCLVATTPPAETETADPAREMVHA
ncbi:MAG: RnfABCDGE type electron transport complex subunit B [Lentisphaeria bacterium]|nr:RnfABCDGE type electron transport complex subunit B [Lentisphaeria bacterium]